MSCFMQAMSINTIIFACCPCMQQKPKIHPIQKRQLSVRGASLSSIVEAGAEEEVDSDKTINAEGRVAPESNKNVNRNSNIDAKWDLDPQFEVESEPAKFTTLYKGQSRSRMSQVLPFYLRYLDPSNTSFIFAPSSAFESQKTTISTLLESKPIKIWPKIDQCKTNKPSFFAETMGKINHTKDNIN